MQWVRLDAMVVPVFISLFIHKNHPSVHESLGPLPVSLFLLQKYLNVIM